MPTLLSLSPMSEGGPADVARAAMAAVQEGRREDWLGSFADDARVEDPVGHVPPIVGRGALAQFWDVGIAPLTSVKFDVSREWEAGEEAMLLATVTVVVPNGTEVSYDGTFNYAIENGRIASLRAFWDMPAVAAAFTA
jgi:steroid delta-isomerase